ncbi:unnamed protein product [Protopolystoma xenopodis]|uniref:Uncharacterized protein n=1 Tax=Protopolystoma xenopodis TaxID=117903 RepID=A0A3S4ZC41_9PLAT|nr:unnamed protein product [Protopolystoma xenopodis]
MWRQTAQPGRRDSHANSQLPLTHKRHSHVFHTNQQLPRWTRSFNGLDGTSAGRYTPFPPSLFVSGRFSLYSPTVLQSRAIRCPRHHLEDDNCFCTPITDIWLNVMPLSSDQWPSYVVVNSAFGCFHDLLPS